jgi:hypothetical protein
MAPVGLSSRVWQMWEIDLNNMSEGIDEWGAMLYNIYVSDNCRKAKRKYDFIKVCYGYIKCFGPVL